MNIGEQDHLETLIGSLNKIFLNAKNKGVIKNKELSLLDIIYNILKSNCFDNISNTEQRCLLSLYYKILNKYTFLCKAELSRNYYLSNNTQKTFVNTNPNTAPIIDDPDPIEPCDNQPPSGCDNGISTYGTFTKVILPIILFTKCFEDPNEGTYKNIKITLLPTKGVITYNDVAVTLNQVIDLTLGGELAYTPIINPTVIEFDPFEVSISGTALPSLYSEPFTITVTLI